jgi:hypothetical protein
MLASQIITQAQTLAGIGVIEGNAINENAYNLSCIILQRTLSDINNDVKLSLFQETADYQNLPQFIANVPQTMGASSGSKLSWAEKVAQAEAAGAPAETPDLSQYEIPWDNSVSDTYPFPKNCRRVLKGLDKTAEWRKTSFADVLKAKKTGQGYMNIYAINNRMIYLSRVSPFQIVYAREFAELQPEDEMDIPAEAETYVVYRLAHDLAMGFNTGSIDRTKAMADKAYKNLLANTSSNAGAVYINPALSYARFNDLAIY